MPPGSPPLSLRAKRIVLAGFALYVVGATAAYIWASRPEDPCPDPAYVEWYRVAAKVGRGSASPYHCGWFAWKGGDPDRIIYEVRE